MDVVPHHAKELNTPAGAREFLGISRKVVVVVSLECGPLQWKESAEEKFAGKGIQNLVRETFMRNTRNPAFNCSGHSVWNLALEGWKSEFIAESFVK